MFIKKKTVWRACSDDFILKKFEVLVNFVVYFEHQMFEKKNSCTI